MRVFGDRALNSNSRRLGGGNVVTSTAVDDTTDRFPGKRTSLRGLSYDQQAAHFIDTAPDDLSAAVLAAEQMNQ